VAFAIDHRPELQALRTSRRQADASVALARKSYYPDFSVNLTYFDLADADIPPSADGKNALALGVSVKVPLQRGRLNAQLEEARLHQNRVDASIESTAAEFRTNIADIVSRLREDERQLTLYRDALIPQAETTLEATLSAYTTGRTDFLNLLDAERVLFTVRVGYEDVFVRYMKTMSMLERQLGVTYLAEFTEMDAD
jgi:outer membrane protein TolC